MATESIPLPAYYEIHPTRGGFAIVRVSDDRAQVIDWFDDQTADPKTAEDFCRSYIASRTGERRQ